jgi:hypothetical protein
VLLSFRRLGGGERQESSAEGGQAADVAVHWPEQPCGKTTGRIVNGALQRLDDKSRPIRNMSELIRRPEACLAPQRIAEPAADAPRDSPCVPSAKFADDQTAAWAKDPDCLSQNWSRILDETEHRDRDDNIKCVRCERQILGGRNLEGDIGAVLLRSFAGGLDHPRRYVDSGDLRTTLPQLDGKLEHRS